MSFPKNGEIGGLPLEANHQTAKALEKCQYVYTETAAESDAPRPSSGGQNGSAIDSDAKRAAIQFEAIKENYKHEWTALIQWARTKPRKDTLRAIVEQRTGITYDTINSTTGTSTRRIRDHINTLNEMGFINKEGRPVTIRIPTVESYVLASDVASLPL